MESKQDLALFRKFSEIFYSAKSFVESKHIDTAREQYLELLSLYEQIQDTTYREIAFEQLLRLRSSIEEWKII